jgi:hypothetical protein
MDGVGIQMPRSLRPILDFDDPGASDDHPAKGVTVGDIRAWHDVMRLALDVMTINEKVRSPAWDGEATEASAIGQMRSAVGASQQKGSCLSG